MSSFIMYDRFGNDMQYWFIGGVVIASIALKEQGSISSTKELFLQRLDDNVFIGISLHGYPDFVVGNDRLFLVYRDKRYTGRMSLSSKLAMLEERYYEENCPFDRSPFFMSPYGQKYFTDRNVQEYNIVAINSMLNEDVYMMDLLSKAYIEASGYYIGKISVPSNKEVFDIWDKLKRQNVYCTREYSDNVVHYPWIKEEGE